MEPESILVAPHDHVDVVMTLNLTPRDAATVNVPQWDFSAVLFADDEARPGSAAGRWEIRGTVNNPLQFDDPNPHFVVQTDEPASAARQSGLGTFAFRSHAALERVEVMQTAGETGLYSAEAIMKSASDGTVRLTFRDDADLPIGEFPTDVRLNCFPADGGTVIERTVPIHVTVRGRFEITPRNIVIGSQQAGSDAGTTVVVTPRESFNYEIVSLTCADESIAAEAVPRSDSRQPTTVVVRYGEPPETDNGAVGKTYLNVVLVLENGTTEARAIPVIVLPSARKKAVPVSNESGAVNSGGRSFVHL
ncbi:MAG: hypothetical protein R3C19_08060 [Planctomycetaceae bacterium]